MTATATAIAAAPGAGPRGDARPSRTKRVRPAATDHVSRTAPLMGGTVSIHLGLADPFDPEERDRARGDADRVLLRLGAWADRLTRFAETSDLSRLNADPRAWVTVRPTLATLLDWGRQAEGLTGGIVDIALLDARLAAEADSPPLEPRHGASAASRAWGIDRLPRGSRVWRSPGVRFDLDGVAKGWLADRAIERLDRYSAVAVDADGDVAVRLAPGRSWRFAVGDPRGARASMLVLELAAPDAAVRSYGLATSGTSVHRWVRDGVRAHHLIDPRTGRPAVTDVVQATVLAGSAREAELLAKTAVILGSQAALAALDRPAVAAAVLLTEDDEVLLTPATLEFVA